MALDWNGLKDLQSPTTGAGAHIQDVRQEGVVLANHMFLVHGAGSVDLETIKYSRRLGPIHHYWEYPAQPEWLEALASYSLQHGSILMASDQGAYSALCAGWRGDMFAVEMFLYANEEV